MIQRIKIISALILIACIFLPLGSCEQKKITAIEPATEETTVQRFSKIEEASTEKTKKGNDYLVPVKNFDITEPDTWIGLIIFIWLLPFLIVKGIFLKTKWKRRIANILELLLAAFSVFFIYTILFGLWYTPMLWGYLAVLSISTYFVLHILELISPVLRFKSNNITRRMNQT